MTILVLELEKPKVMTWTNLWDLRMNFFASLFPYSTSIVASDFNNSTAQVFYGIIIILVSLSNIGISHSLNKVNTKHRFKALFEMPCGLGAVDLGIKILGMILSLTIFPPATMYLIFIASAMLIIVSSIHSKKFNL